MRTNFLNDAEHAIDSEAVSFRTKRFTVALRELRLHSIIKAELLTGRTKEWIAKTHHLAKKTIVDVAERPFTELEYLHNHYGFDPSDMLECILAAPNDLLASRSAIAAVMAYDCDRIGASEPPSVLEVRYNTSALDMIQHLQRLHGHTTVGGRSFRAPQYSAALVEYCAHQLGVTLDQTVRAKQEVVSWLTTPVVAEVADIVHMSAARQAVGTDRPRRLDHKLSRLRYARETAEINAYGRPRPTTGDTDISPQALGRDLLLVAEKTNTRVELIDGRSRQVRDFGAAIGVSATGLDERGNVLADEPDGWITVVDDALYAHHGVHLPHIALQEDTPWPRNAAELD